MDKRKVLVYVLGWRAWIADVMYLLSDSHTKELIAEDLTRYMKKETSYQKVGIVSLNYCLLFGQTFRNVFYYRIQGHGLLKSMSKMFIKPLETVEIGGKIGGGMRVNHKNAVIFPYSIGKNLTVGPNVVIGKGPCHDNGDINSPIIGDNVSILPNAVVTGGIKIGNNVTIGAGTIVVKSIPDNCVVIGNPAKILEK